MGYWGFQPYVSVAKRRANALKEVSNLAKSGQNISPVKIDGKKIAFTFWGKSWCANLEAYSDYASRLPRGRSYVRNGSVVDLQVAPGRITALVSGSRLYRVKIDIEPLKKSTWDCIRSGCAGQISSVIELLQGRISEHVMRQVTNQSTGLFPTPREIELSCSCPDGAYMCKHIAAALYGVGARLDAQPDLLFALRKVDHLDLVAQASNLGALPAGAAENTINSADLADVFGIELDEPAPTAALVSAPAQVNTTNRVQVISPKPTRAGRSKKISISENEPKAETKRRSRKVAAVESRQRKNKKTSSTSKSSK